MESSTYKILFFLENEQFILAEVKRTDLPDLPKDQKFHWVIFDKVSCFTEKLSFVSMNSSENFQERTFKQGKLKFNEFQGVFEREEESFVLQNHTGRLLPEAMFRLICCYLDSLY